VDHRLRRERLARRLPELGIDGLLVTRLPNVRYLTGFTGSNGQVLVVPGGAVFFTDGRYGEQSRREVPEVERVVSRDPLPAAVAAAADRGIGRLGFEAAGVTYRTWEQLRAVDGTELVPVGPEVETLRRVKDRAEVEAIERAQEAADLAFERAVLGGALREGIAERDLALELELAMRRAGADEPGFETIVAFGENAAEPHHHPGDRALARGDVVKLDFGALRDGYRSDMTRTVAFGAPPARLRELHDLVAIAQRAGVAAARDGASTKEVDRAARRVIEEAGLGEAFPHGLGHGVGLEIHEDPFLRWDREEPLAEGMVVTVEPGVYVPGLGGVRIEDMVEITADGCRVLPRSTKELILL
jgi:Xaa-Pro aminopeptidase